MDSSFDEFPISSVHAPMQTVRRISGPEGGYISLSGPKAGVFFQQARRADTYSAPGAAWGTGCGPMERPGGPTYIQPHAQPGNTGCGQLGRPGGPTYIQPQAQPGEPDADRWKGPEGRHIFSPRRRTGCGQLERPGGLRYIPALVVVQISGFTLDVYPSPSGLSVFFPPKPQAAPGAEYMSALRA